MPAWLNLLQNATAARELDLDKGKCFFEQFIGETTDNMTNVDAAWDPRKCLDHFRRLFVTLIPNTAICRKRN